eukprot:CAMPEP_0117609952 /NCGR_PEP_ID=MMETSP0784-20121206/81612_1 /TAXON_ID=39447 /ORGANISM="" /LENGTH=73 /DNA_ID=CAMNT_0005413319 /DNA_START=180 /DNA_END=399 /DNA_ORIENTATION=+
MWCHAAQTAQSTPTITVLEVPMMNGTECQTGAFLGEEPLAAAPLSPSGQVLLASVVVGSDVVAADVVVRDGAA